MSTKKKTAIIISATSAMAEAMCQKMVKEKWSLVLIARDKEKLKRLETDLKIRSNGDIKTYCIDVQKEFGLLKKTLKSFKKCDALIIFTGAMNSGQAFDENNIKQLININYTIPAQITGLMAEKMQQQKSGTIVFISSVAGDRGRQSNYIYGSAKSGITAYASGLRNKLYPYGVHVMTVKPGYIDTPMTYGINSPLIISRERAANSIYKAMLQKKNSIYVPFFWRYIMLIIKSIPECVFKKLKL